MLSSHESQGAGTPAALDCGTDDGTPDAKAECEEAWAEDPLCRRGDDVVVTSFAYAGGFAGTNS